MPLQHVEQAGPHHPVAIDPPGEATMRVGQMRQLVRDDGAELIGRQCRKQRITEKERVRGPEHPAWWCLYDRRVARTGHDDPMYARGTDSSGDDPDLVMKTRAETRPDVDAR